MLLPVILSGGSGTRLWPLSRELYPKQLLRLTGENTMLQETLKRISGISGISAPLIVGNESHRFMIAEQIRQIHLRPVAIILEPEGKNTAPAAAAAALFAAEKKKDPVMVILPADHVIGDVKPFLAALKKGAQYAEKGHLITFGIKPNSAETGYGYIKTGQQIAANRRGNNATAFRIERFEEKPSLSRAKRFISSGSYFWNSGIFMFKASAYLRELNKHSPEILIASEAAIKRSVRDRDFLRLNPDAFRSCPSDSIDYAVMEKTDSGIVIPLDAKWSDVGSWSSLWEVLPKDRNGNAFSGDVVALNVGDSLIHSESRLVAAEGIKDCIIVETADAVLVADRKHPQEIKLVVEALKKKQRNETVTHRRVSRPWGAYECIDIADRFQVKRITVNAGAGLSLQKHIHRAEHWIVVKGTARVTRGKKVMILSENESTYIPPGVKHRLENPGKIPLEMIEVQSGSYLGEDDIERFDDKYGRIP